MVEFHDTLILDRKARRLTTGELAASVRCARTGLQDYTGSEVGRPDLARVAVYRPEPEVMKRDSIASFAGVPVTIEHPREAVTTDNWKQYAVGETGEEVLRDGEFIRVPILVRDENAIRAIEDGKRQISMGYSCELSFEDGLTPDGEPYQAVQRGIKINHLAIVDRARGGEKLTVTDERTYSNDFPGDKNKPANDGDLKMPHTLMIDGLQVPNVSDEAKAAIEKLQSQARLADEAKAKAEGDRDAALKDKATLEGEKTVLEQKVKDAELSPTQLEKLVADRAALIGQAKAIDPNVVTDGKTEVEIKRAVLATKLGDAAKDLADAAVDGAFAYAAKDVKPVETTDQLRDAIRNTPRTSVNDSGASVRNLARAAQY